MRILAIILWLLFPAPVLADEPACLAKPDQGCLFDLALARALGQEKLDDIAGDVLAIAVTQERAGTDRALGTLKQLLDLVVAREPEGLKRIAVLNGAVLGVEMTGAPKVAAALAMAVAATETDDPVERERLELRALVYAGEVAEVRDRLEAAGSGVQAGLALAAATALMQAGDYTAAFQIADLVELEDFRADMDETAVIILLRQGQVEAARVAAATTGDRATQAMSLARVAKALAEDGQRDEALKVIAEIDATTGISGGSPILVFAKAEVLARLGESDRAEALLATLPADAVPPRRLSEVRAIAALVAGDVDGFLAIVATAERVPEGGFWVKSAVKAKLEAGLGEMEPVRARLSPDQLPYGLNALGLHQAVAGDTVAALETLARLQGLGDIGRVHGDFRAGLARRLVQEGWVVEGVTLAVAGGNPRLIAEIAALLPN